jgi:hypothetical protein
MDLLFNVLRPAQKYFTYMEVLPLPVIRSMLGAKGIWAGRNIYRATPAVTQGVASEGPPNSVASYDTHENADNLFY